MPKTLDEKIDWILKRISSLHHEERRLRRMNTRNAEVRRQIVVGKIDGYCDELRKQIEALTASVQEEARLLDPKILLMTRNIH